MLRRCGNSGKSVVKQVHSDPLQAYKNNNNEWSDTDNDGIAEVFVRKNIKNPELNPPNWSSPVYPPSKTISNPYSHTLFNDDQCGGNCPQRGTPYKGFAGQFGCTGIAV